MALMTAAILEGIATRYNTQYANILTRAVGLGSVPDDMKPVITAMLADFSLLMTDINADDALGVTIAGYGVLPSLVANLDAGFSSGSAVSIASASAFSSPTAVTTYALASGSALPAWLTLTAGTGVIAGTAPTVTTSTPFTFQITATNAFGTSVASTIKVTIG